MDEIEHNEKHGLLNKTQDELTVADNLKLVAIVTAAFVAIPVVLGGVAAGLGAFAESRKQKKLNETFAPPIVETTGQEI